ncbi:hypothetical protein NMY3_02196 [Candidatus Nitrosocosmicus oleophilus]|uniref:Uncharacterized protein n=1 Tax=Candidatus Nitrosocosmicus oleophilus TaxID=1353260 RepID=A0A654M136_9ARCH|nr:hypothetical protein [Candidatus Nitrosocosmicus oleophilus]ALI36396.1 hypothetical protein NMY3_02196 [Candidatus Nitrosocosmicus oleophilus]
MVKISLDEINLSKMHLEFVGETDRRCKTLNKCLGLNTVKVPFNYSSIILRTKIGLNNMSEIGGIL